MELQWYIAVFCALYLRYVYSIARALIEKTKHQPVQAIWTWEGSKNDRTQLSHPSLVKILLVGDRYCGGLLDRSSGSLKTPNWPEKDYPAGVTCTWHIVAPRNQVRSFYQVRYLKEQPAILIQYTFCRIQWAAPHSPSAALSVCAIKKTCVFVYSPGSVNGKQTIWLRPSFRSMKGWGYIWWAAELKYQQPFTRIVDWTFKCIMIFPRNSLELITGPFSHQIIELRFEKFDVERDNYCRYDHVAIFNGEEASEARRIGRFCGDSPPA